MALEGYWVKEIDKRVATAVIVEHHYLHRKPPPITHAFGLFSPQWVLVGVAIYSSPPSPTLIRGIAGKEYAKDVIELSRLWVDDSVPRNGESFFVGNTIPLVSKKIIVSFADPSYGHVGTIYQASNWLYAGMTHPMTHWEVEGFEGHHRQATRHMTLAQIKEKFGDRAKRVPDPRKHRYLYINTKGRERKEIMGAIKYPILPYPKVQVTR